MNINNTDTLILRVANGDMDALEKLYTELSPAVYALALTIVKDRDAAEDIRQDTFVKVYFGASGFSASGFGKAWILRIARNLSLNAVSRIHMESNEEVLEDTPAPDRPAEDAVIKLAVSRAIDRLTDDEQQIVRLHALSGATLAEIARVMDMPLGTVKWKHAEALKKLRRSICSD